MKKIICVVFLMIFTLSASLAFAAKSDPKSAVPDKKENKLSKEEINRMNNRAEEIRGMDKTNLTVKERHDLRKELKEIKQVERRDGYGYYYGGATLILIIILVIILLR